MRHYLVFTDYAITSIGWLVVFTMYIQKFLHRPRVRLCLCDIVLGPNNGLSWRVWIFFQTINPTVKRTTCTNPDRTDNRFWFSWNTQQWSTINEIVLSQICVCVSPEKTIVLSSFLGRRVEMPVRGYVETQQLMIILLDI